tara:strand:- start:2350 stop:3036 length:687 start_codon:yes stop_codon:yes gene_type:complete
MKGDIRLGKRLGEIAKLITQHHPYDHIWDCCCDHGYLGTYLLSHYSKQTKHKVQINFVDQVTHITGQLRDKLKQSAYSHYEVHTVDAGQLELDKHKRHCIIIAGVTTTGTLKILQTLLSQHPKQKLDFILCPTRGQYDLRQYLRKQNAHLYEEQHILENGRHYELVYVCFDENQVQEDHKQVSNIGQFWQQDNKEHVSYLKNRICYFEQEVLNQTNLMPLKRCSFIQT